MSSPPFVLAVIGCVFACAGVWAAETAAWPPSPEAQARMKELRTTLASREASAEEREGARRELDRLLRAPGAPAPKGRQPARAAIQQLPSVVRSEAPAATPAPPVASVVPAPRTDPPLAEPATGRVVVPSKSVIDPATGAVLRETPLGYIDPVTGRRIPKK